MQKQQRLANGLWVTLTHDPGASRAAALFHLSAGSHHEPQRWPGLAHLHEHVVFAGSQRYQGEQRLMSWAQAEGARLNATTLPTATAWFFDIRPDKLEEGFARLVDMLAQPLLACDAIAQEITVIDAEYRMLSSDVETLCEAALGAAFDSPSALRRFHVGSLAHFGDDIDALQQALRHYQRRLFHTGNLTLSLSGPQSVEELALLAERYANALPAADGEVAPQTAPLKLDALRTFSLTQQGAPRLHLSFMLQDIHRADACLLTLLRQLVTDEAEHSLLAVLRERGYCDSLQLLLPYSSDNGSIITFEFMLNEKNESLASQTESVFRHWLGKLSALLQPQLQHYAKLAAKAFARLTPVDKQRTTAFGFPPIAADDAALPRKWQRLLDALVIDNMTRLWVSPDVKAENQHIQGFSLPLAAISPWLAKITPEPALAFYPLCNQQPLPLLPVQSINLPHYQQDNPQGVLILGPAAGEVLSLRWANIIQASLSAIAAGCAHAGGSLSFERHQGQWLLLLGGDNALILKTMDDVIHRLSSLSETLRAQGERQTTQQQQALQTDIAIRCLLNQLPRLLGGEQIAELQQTDFTSENEFEAQTESLEAGDGETLPGLSWNAALYGANRELHTSVSHLLSRFPGEINALRVTPTAPQPSRAQYAFCTTSTDAAVLLFCPLVEPTASCLAAWQIMASLFEPLFFQRLRVEQNLGYVVTCRFMQTAGESGILFAVQSPSHNIEQIFAEITRFIRDSVENIAHLDRHTLVEKITALQQSLEVVPPDNLEQSREQWLRQHHFAPPLTADAVSHLSLPQLHDFARRLSQQKAHWWLLVNTPC